MAKHNDTGTEGRSVRLLRVGEQFRHILSELLARGEVHDDVLNSHSVSVTEVRMSPDLRHATAFIKPFADGTTRGRFEPSTPASKNSRRRGCIIQCV